MNNSFKINDDLRAKLEVLSQESAKRITGKLDPIDQNGDTECGEQCKVSCAHYCHAKCEGFCGDLGSKT